MQNKMDFTLFGYKQLILALQSQGFFFKLLKNTFRTPDIVNWFIG